MIKYFPILLGLIIIENLPAQVQQLGHSEARLSAQVNITEGQLDIQGPASIVGSYVQSMSILLNNDDIILTYTLTEGRDIDEYRIDIRTTLDGREVILHEQDLLGDVSQRVSASPGGSYTITWSGLLDRYFHFEGVLEMEVNIDLWGAPILPFGVVCGEIPTFSTKQRLPYYLAAGVGVATIGTSLFLGREADDIYENDYKKQPFEQSAEPFYREANDIHHQELVLRYSGIGIIAVDLALYIYRLSRHRKKIDTYREFCGGNPISIAPVYRKTSPFIPGSHVGLKLAYSF